jgi:hypothetical protein
MFLSVERTSREEVQDMVKVDRIAAAVASILMFFAACDNPATPESPMPSPTPAPTATPVPAPTPTPTPTPTPSEAPVENTSPAARVTMRLYTIEDGAGNFIANPDPSEPIPIGYWARIDVTSKDEKGKDTNGNGRVDFFFSNPRWIEVTGGHTNQRRLRALAPTGVDCWATQDGVRSNTLTLTFK